MALNLQRLFLAFACAVCMNAASAMFITVEDTIFFCDGVTDEDPCDATNNFALTFPNIAAGADGTATLTLFGDFNDAGENADITNPSFGGGLVLNNVPGDDSFANDSFGDVGNQYVSPISMDLGGSVPQSFINSLLGTTATDTSITMSSTVNNLDFLGSRAFATLTVQYQAAEAVPAPATLALFGLGLAGLGWARRKRA